jgi:hypothetical protein
VTYEGLCLEDNQAWAYYTVKHRLENLVEVIRRTAARYEVINPEFPSKMTLRRRWPATPSIDAATVTAPNHLYAAGDKRRWKLLGSCRQLSNQNKRAVRPQCVQCLLLDRQNASCFNGESMPRHPVVSGICWRERVLASTFAVAPDYVANYSIPGRMSAP